MKNMPQIQKGQTVNTPQGKGVFIMAGRWIENNQLIDEIGYRIQLQQGTVDFEVATLRRLNPSIFFPAHKGEIAFKNERNSNG